MDLMELHSSATSSMNGNHLTSTSCSMYIAIHVTCVYVHRWQAVMTSTGNVHSIDSSLLTYSRQNEVIFTNVVVLFMHITFSSA